MLVFVLVLEKKNYYDKKSKTTENKYLDIDIERVWVDHI